VDINFRVDKSKYKPEQIEKAMMRARETTIDALADAVYREVKGQIRQVFDRPTPYTQNSLQVTRTKNHNMKASVWFKDPDRLVQHYLEPQVEGGARGLKRFEKVLGKHFVPSVHTALNAYGNMPYGKIVQILSVLKLAEYMAGYSANITERSKKRNQKPRDYVWIMKKTGRLAPGIYERYATAQGFGPKARKTMPFGEHQKGKTVGKFSSVIRARGLRPVMMEVSVPHYSVRLPFYAIGNRIIKANYAAVFAQMMARFMGR
jgi:hypothetical protein